MNAKQILSAIFAQASIREIEFKEEWKNGTGYFDHAVKGVYAPKLTIGEVVKSQWPGSRRLVMVGTPLGNVVIFERYTNLDNDVVVANMPRTIENIMQAHGSLSVDKIAHLLGLTLGTDVVYSFEGSNIGHFVNSIVKAAQKMQQLETV